MDGKELTTHNAACTTIGFRSSNPGMSNASLSVLPYSIVSRPGNPVNAWYCFRLSHAFAETHVHPPLMAIATTMLEANALGSCWHYGTRHRRDHRGGAEAAAQDVACLRDGEQGTVRRAFDQS